MGVRMSKYERWPFCVSYLHPLVTVLDETELNKDLRLCKSFSPLQQKLILIKLFVAEEIAQSLLD